MSILEVVNLITIGMSSFNVKNQVPNDIPDHNGFIDPHNLKSQEYIDNISQWTTDQKMKLNEKKSSVMIFNFSQKQFTTRLKMNNEILPVVNKVKLSGATLTNDLKWDENTSYLIKRANSRLLLLRKASEYTNKIEDLKSIYLSHVRSILEQSCVIWHSSLTKENIENLEKCTEKKKTSRNEVPSVSCEDCGTMFVYLSSYIRHSRSKSACAKALKKKKLRKVSQINMT